MVVTAVSSLWKFPDTRAGSVFRFDAAAVALDGKLLVIQGWNSHLGALSAVLEYDPGDGSWKELPSLLTARWERIAIVVGAEELCSWGGTGGTRVVS